MSNNNMQSGYPSASMSMANYIDDEAAVQVTEELRELTIANYHRDRSPQVLVSVSDSAQPTSLEAYLNHSGIPPRAVMALLGAIHGEPSNPLVPSASRTALQSRHSNQAMIRPRTELDRFEQSSRFVDPSSGRAAIWTQGIASSDFTNTGTTASAIDGSVEKSRITSAKDDFLAAPPTNGSSMTAAASLQSRIFPTRQPHGPPPTLEPGNEINFGRLRSQTYPPPGNNIQSGLSSQDSSLRRQYNPPSSRAVNGSGTGIASPSFTQAPRFPPSQMRLRLLEEASAARLQDTSEPEGPKYLGDTESGLYRSQIPGLPDALNCSLWLSNIPPSAAPAEIFDQIDDGAVVALHVSKPDATHPMAAATLIFKAPESAARFFNRSKSWAGIWVKGQRLFVRYNIRGAERRSDLRTRVLLVDGPIEIMTREYWKDFFQFCVFDWDRAIDLPSLINGRGRMEFRFMRIEAQATMCMKAIYESLAHMEVEARYGLDPCSINTPPNPQV